ncbi:MAG: nucleotidyltransferase domain-containing protein [bacterium]
MTSVERAVAQRLRELVSRRLPVHRVVVFGSRARGDADPDSDLDVLVIVARTLTPADEEFVSDCAWEAGFGHGIVVVPVVFSLDEWERGPESRSLLARAVATDGVAV